MSATWICSMARPSLDIKPYVAYSDAHPESGTGWLGERDPRPSHIVAFTADAEAQLAWISAHAALPLRERIETTLKLGPQPHPYRRIRRGKDGGMILAVQDWRIDFRVDGERIEVLRLRSGYKPSQLEKSSDAPAPLDLHRQFRARFG